MSIPEGTGGPDGLGRVVHPTDDGYVVVDSPNNDDIGKNVNNTSQPERTGNWWYDHLFDDDKDDDDDRNTRNKPGVDMAWYRKLEQQREKERLAREKAEREAERLRLEKERRLRKQELAFTDSQIYFGAAENQWGQTPGVTNAFYLETNSDETIRLDFTVTGNHDVALDDLVSEETEIAILSSPYLFLDADNIQDFQNNIGFDLDVVDMEIIQDNWDALQASVAQQYQRGSQWEWHVISEADRITALENRERDLFVRDTLMQSSQEIRIEQQRQQHIFILEGTNQLYGSPDMPLPQELDSMTLDKLANLAGGEDNTERAANAYQKIIGWALVADPQSSANMYDAFLSLSPEERLDFLASVQLNMELPAGFIPGDEIDPNFFNPIFTMSLRGEPPSQRVIDLVGFSVEEARQNLVSSANDPLVRDRTLSGHPLFVEEALGDSVIDLPSGIGSFVDIADDISLEFGALLHGASVIGFNPFAKVDSATEAVIQGDILRANAIAQQTPANLSVVQSIPRVPTSDGSTILYRADRYLLPPPILSVDAQQRGIVASQLLYHQAIQTGISPDDLAYLTGSKMHDDLLPKDLLPQYQGILANPGGAGIGRLGIPLSANPGVSNLYYPGGPLLVIRYPGNPNAGSIPPIRVPTQSNILTPGMNLSIEHQMMEEEWVFFVSVPPENVIGTIDRNIVPVLYDKKNFLVTGE